MENENTTGASHHISVKTLEEAVGEYLAQVSSLSWSTGAGAAENKDALHRLTRKLQAALDVRLGSVPVPRLAYEQTSKGKGHNLEARERHESYGVVSISRVSGTRRLFGSEVNHQNYFNISVRRATRVIQTHGESFYGFQAPIVSFALSAAQFVDMIANQNIGSGVPCTITSVEGVSMDLCPEGIGSELKATTEIFKENLREFTEEFDAHEKSVEAILEKKSLTKVDKTELLDFFAKGRKLILHTAPFVSEMVMEQAEKVVAKGKMEIDSFISLAIHKAGIKAIRDSGGSLILGSGGDEVSATHDHDLEEARLNLEARCAK